MIKPRHTAFLTIKIYIMKTQLKSVLLLIGVSSLFIIGCQKSDSFVSSNQSSAKSVQSSDESVISSDEFDQSIAEDNSQSSANRIPAYITTTSVTAIGVPPVVIKTGTFVASHELGDTGLYVMHIKFFGQSQDSIHCLTEFYPNRGGRWVTDSRCSIVTNIGLWGIIQSQGSGPYKDLRGHGSVTMIPGHEMGTGKITFQ